LATRVSTSAFTVDSISGFSSSPARSGASANAARSS
jgi:hypothetical protein